MNGLFGFGWIDTLVKLIIFVLVFIMITLIKRNVLRKNSEAKK